MRRLRLGSALLLAAWPACAFGQSNLPFEYQAAHAQEPDAGLQAPSAYPKTLRYGETAGQTIDFYPATGAAQAPLVIAFSNSAEGWPRYRFNRAGIALAIVRERETVPTAQKTIANYLAAAAYLYRDAAKFGIDRTRIVLYGDSIAALLGTDPALFDGAGVPFDSVRGVIVFGGEDFDIVRRTQTSAYLRSAYQRYYGRDEAEAATLSPINHLQAPNAPAFLLFADERDNDAEDETRSFTKALVNAGTPATFVTLPEPHGQVRRTHFLVEEGGSGWEMMGFVLKAFGVSG